MGSVLMEGGVESLKEKHMNGVKAFLLAVCFTKTWPAVCCRTNEVGL